MASPKSLVLITGANSGIGFEVANQLLAEGSFHVLLGVRSEAKGKAAIAELESRNLPGTAELLIIDVSSESSVAAAAEVVEEKHGRLDALVNNAGIAIGQGTLAEQMVQCFQSSALGAQIVGDAFVPLLRKTTSGTPRIVDVTSGAGSITNRMDPKGMGKGFQYVPYSVSKAALNMVFACQFDSLTADGFKVFLYGPGPTASKLTPINEGPGMKPTSVGAAPIVEMVMGKRDGDAGKYIEYGIGEFPW
ncbi:NAD(P)-binding protein [Nemania sp. FL0916]|nr:NAD(P)-binding protein [Nemania sp. FL0916]